MKSSRRPYGRGVRRCATGPITTGVRVRTSGVAGFIRGTGHAVL